jgi:hypothetical protein
VTDLLIGAPRRRRQGARPLPAPDVADAATTFNGVYMRPNLQSNGEVPAQGSLCTCPDIWITQSPVANWATALATPASYGTDSGNQVNYYDTNYIYLRAKNNTTTAQTKTIQVYYAPSNVIQEPSRWEPNQLQTDQGNTVANIANLAPGAIGVGDQTFVWDDTQPPSDGSDHYCLIAQVNDAQNSNPAPSVDTLFDLSSLVQNNLGFGWKNLHPVWAAQPAFEYNMQLTIPQNIPSRENYTIGVAPVGWVGYYVSISVSQTDADGKPIELVKSKVVQDGAGLACPPCPLDPGFNALVSVYVTNDDHVGAPQAGAKIPLSCQYNPGPSEALEAVRRGLVDWTFTYALLLQDMLGDAPGIGPTVACPVGTYTWVLTPNQPHQEVKP